MSPIFSFVTPLTLLALAAASGPAQAGAATDGSVGPVQALSGRFTVPQTLGTLRGANLFHSFARFSIAPGESATFTTTDAGIRHVVSRVTGGEASLLQGPLTLQAAAGSRPDFWFVNPSGITVGAGASFDVPAGLHLATAPQVRFTDGTDFGSGPGAGSSLTVADPQAFGFLGAAAGALRWQSADLVLAEGSALTLAGGSVSVSRSVLIAPQGSIAVAARGAVEIADGARLFATAGNAPGSGAVRIAGASLAIDGRGARTGPVVDIGVAEPGPGAGIAIDVEGALVMSDGAEITLASDSAQPVGGIRVAAASLQMTGGSRAASMTTLSAGAAEGPALTVDVTGSTRLARGSQLVTATFGDRAGGALTLRSGSIELDGQGSFALVATRSLETATGATGPLAVQAAGELRLHDGGLVTSQALALGAAGPMSVRAGSLAADRAGSARTTGVQSLGGGPLAVDVTDAIELHHGAGIDSWSHELFAPAPLRVSAGRIVLDGGGDSSAQILGLSSTPQPPADLQIDVRGPLRLDRGGQISSATLGGGDAGSVTIRAATLEMSGGGDYVTTIDSSAFGDSPASRAGTVGIEVGTLRLTGGANIATNATQGSASRVAIRADTVELDGQGQPGGLRSFAFGATGNAGSIRIDARSRVTILGGAGVFAGTAGRGDAGSIVVDTPELLIDGSAAPFFVTGIAGDVLAGLGAGAAVDVRASRVEIRQGGTITTSTQTTTDAGSIRVVADTLLVDGGNRLSATGISADSGGAGRSGDITLQVGRIELRNEALVSSSAFGAGAGGLIRVDAGSALVDGGAGIVSVTGGRGNAGSIELGIAGDLWLRDGGGVTANTGGAGAAGNIRIRAGRLLAGGSDASSGLASQVASRARAGSGGQPGRIAIEVAGELRLDEGARFTIANDARVASPAAIAPRSLAVDAGSLAMTGSEITAASSVNADAGTITIRAAGDLRLDRASIRTSAQDGNGGAIRIDSQGAVRLDDSSVTTSVLGRNNGNGGDIAIAARSLLLSSGFVQANTAAPRASGGNVTLDAGVLLPDGSNVFIGGNRIQGFVAGVPGFNVIQAAAPDGVGGRLDLARPELSVSSTLAALATPRIDFGLLGADVCRVGVDSSFTVLGQGALPASTTTPLRVRP